MGFKLLPNPSSWRRLSIATWKVPDNSSVYSYFSEDATPVLHFLSKINQSSPVKITITHLIAKATALVLKKYPDINGIIRWRRIYLRESVVLFLQVAIPAENSDQKPDLSGAVIRECEKKTIIQIAEELNAKCQAIRKKQDPQFKKSIGLFNKTPPLFLSWMLRLATFLSYNLGLSFPKLGIIKDPFGLAMITNLGSFGVPAPLGPLVPPSRVPLLLCLGVIADKPWVVYPEPGREVDGKVEARPVFEMGVTFDHRFMDGSTASKMYKMMREILREPEKWLSV